MPFDFQAWADRIGQNFCNRRFDLNASLYRFPSAFYEGESVDVLPNALEYDTWVRGLRDRFDPYGLARIDQSVEDLSISLKDRRILRVRSTLLDKQGQPFAVYVLRYYLEFREFEPKIGLVQVVDTPDSKPIPVEPK